MTHDELRIHRYYKYIGTLHLCLYRCVSVYARYGRDVCLAKDEYSFTELCDRLHDPASDSETTF